MRVYEGVEADSRYSDSNTGLSFSHEWYTKHSNLTILLNTHSNTIAQKRVTKRNTPEITTPSLTALRTPLEDSTTVPILQMGKQRWKRVKSCTTSCSYPQAMVQTQAVCDQSPPSQSCHDTVSPLWHGSHSYYRPLSFLPYQTVNSIKVEIMFYLVLLTLSSHWKLEHDSISQDSYFERSKIKW